MGGVIAPLLHELHHGIEILSGTHHGLPHEHPDYDALGDNSPHLDDKELSCVLCSFSLPGEITETFLFSIPDSDTAHSDLEVLYQVIHGSSFPIRGPPANC